MVVAAQIIGQPEKGSNYKAGPYGKMLKKQQKALVRTDNVTGQASMFQHF